MKDAKKSKHGKSTQAAHCQKLPMSYKKRGENMNDLEGELEYLIREFRVLTKMIKNKFIYNLLESFVDTIESISKYAKNKLKD